MHCMDAMPKAQNKLLQVKKTCQTDSRIIMVLVLMIDRSGPSLDFTFIRSKVYCKIAWSR